LSGSSTLESFHLTLRFQALENELAFINLNENPVNNFFDKFSIRVNYQKKFPLNPGV